MHVSPSTRLATCSVLLYRLLVGRFMRLQTPPSWGGGVHNIMNIFQWNNFANSLAKSRSLSPSVPSTWIEPRSNAHINCTNPFLSLLCQLPGIQVFNTLTSILSLSFIQPTRPYVLIFCTRTSSKINRGLNPALKWQLRRKRFYICRSQPERQETESTFWELVWSYTLIYPSNNYCASTVCF